MRANDARRLDHATLEAMRERAVRSVQDGESPEVVADVLGINRSTIYGWLAQYRSGGFWLNSASPARSRCIVRWNGTKLWCSNGSSRNSQGSKLWRSGKRLRFTSATPRTCARIIMRVAPGAGRGRPPLYRVQGRGIA